MNIRLGASIDELPRVGEAVAAFCAANDIGEKQTYQLQLVCDEWVTNIIVHGYGHSPPGPAEDQPIEVSAALTEDRMVRIVIKDTAPPFNPLLIPLPDVTLPLEERPVGGLGIHFIRKTMDHCAYTRTEKHNRLELAVRIDRKQEERSDGSDD